MNEIETDTKSGYEILARHVNRERGAPKLSSVLTAAANIHSSQYILQQN